MTQRKPRKTTRTTFGNVRKLPSGNWQARYQGPDKMPYKAPMTFEAKEDAESWLALQRAQIVQDLWNVPKPEGKPLTFAE